MYRKQNGEPITDEEALDAIGEILFCDDSTETECVFPDGERFPWEAIKTCGNSIEPESYPWASEWLERYLAKHGEAFEYHGVVYELNPLAFDRDDIEWDAKLVLGSISPCGPSIVWRDLDGDLKPYDATGRLAEEWSDRPNRLYRLTHYSKGDMKAPETFDEVEDQANKSAMYEDGFIYNYVFTDSDIVASSLL